MKNRKGPLASKKAAKITALAAIGIGVVLFVGNVASCGAFMVDAAEVASVNTTPTSGPYATGGTDGQEFPEPGTATDQDACRDTTYRWASTLLDDTLPANKWAAGLTSQTAPEATQALGGIDRDTLPKGDITKIETATRVGACDALITTSGGGSFVVQAAAGASGAWSVTGWVPGD